MPPTEENAKLGPPNRWLNCPRKGDIIANKFVPFKTPLCELYDSYVPEHCRFYPQMLLRAFDTKGPGRIGLWIDLTNTDRYYDKKTIETENIRYIKLNCKGHGEAPLPEDTENFVRVCQRFISERPRELIGVHCTHGFNRTGYLICAYLIMKNDWDPEAAVIAFSSARRPGIYKQDYLDTLITRYGDNLDKIKAPEKPDWDSKDESKVSEDIILHKKIENKATKQTPLFMDGAVPEIVYEDDPEKRAYVQKMCQDICNFKRRGFPGGQPVSMEMCKQRGNIHLLIEKKYVVSWKADGVRYMMLIIDADQIYMFDRDHNPFKIPCKRLTFPTRKGTTLCNTLLDGEMIFDEVEGHKIPRYLIYDAINIGDVKDKGKDIWKCPFNIRIDCIKGEIIIPRTNQLLEGIIDRSSQIMSVRMKDFWYATAKNVKKLLSPEFAKDVSHEIDGLIFQPEEDVYKCGRTENVLKWKPPHLQTIDFQLRLTKSPPKVGVLPKWQAELWVQNQQYTSMTYTKELQKYNGKIIECHFVGDVNTGHWEILRERTDKSLPNAYNTAESVCRSIRWPISKEILIEFIAEHSYFREKQEIKREEVKHRAMPPPENPVSKRPRIAPTS